jgi:Zn-dependent protease with chaperone function
MRVGVRAGVAAALLVLFYGLLAMVTWFGALIIRRAVSDPTYAGSQRVVIAIFGLFFVVPAIRVVNAAVRKQAPNQPGVSVDRAAQPELWTFVEALANACRVATPTRIVITAEVNAAAQSSAAMFGTLKRDRTVYLGLPLLAAMETAQAAAVICHELGHHANGDSRVAALTYRSGDALLATLRRGKLKLLGWLTDGLFGAFAGMYFSVTFALRRKQEFSADQLAACVVGTEAAATALESMSLVRAAYSIYLQGVGSEGPPRSAAERAADMSGFRGFLDNSTIKLESQSRNRRADLFDSHPPTPERVAAIRETAHLPGIAIAPGKAIELLHGPDELAQVVVNAVLIDRKGQSNARGARARTGSQTSPNTARPE